MRATSSATQRKIVVMRKNNQYNSGKFLKPSHLAHKLRKARKQFYVKNQYEGEESAVSAKQTILYYTWFKWV